ncbi:hypothetical protein [Actinacidiphila paucisporea]|nr:hypothetical protein [Actinacidiphila paucisporea]
MRSKQILTVIALVTVCLWSAVMAVLGQLTAMVTLVPSLGLLVQQIAAALGDGPPLLTSKQLPADAIGEAHGDEAAAGEERAR